LKTYIYSSNDSLFTPSVKECKSKSGCEFILEAKEEGQGYLYFGEGERKNVTEEILIEFEKRYSQKIK
jgi:hypothetical protein